MKTTNMYHLKKLTSSFVLAGKISVSLFSPVRSLAQQPMPASKVEALKKELVTEIENQKKFTQEMVDMVFSFGELGFQEVESSKYVTDILKKNGFVIEMGIAGIPTAWTAKWGSGKPLIAIGSDIDCIPKAWQKPGKW